MGWRRVADILMGMQARDVVVKASYAKALREEREEVRKDTRTELNDRYYSIQETCQHYPKAEEERQSFLRAYPMMKNVEYQQKIGMCPTPLLRGYVSLFYSYMSKMKLGEAKEATRVPIPEIPSLSMPSLSITSLGLPDTGDVKKSLQVTGLVIIAVVLLIFYMLTGRGRKGVTVVT